LIVRHRWIEPEAADEPTTTPVGLIAATATACLMAGAAATAATAQAATTGCQVAYTIGSQSAGGFTANVALTNLGDPVTGWTLRWTFGGGQSVTQAWNVTAAQSGSAVSVGNVSWNGALATNGSASFGFNGTVMVEAQRFFKTQLGKTFTLNAPVVEVVNGLHDTSWYINNNCTPGGDRYACVIFNMQGELQQSFGLNNPDSRWLMVAEASAEEAGQSGGGGQPGWVQLSGHDADGAAGKTEPMPRWYGGMVHELGHAFGLPDATSTDGTCMSASFYGYPNCTFSQAQKDGMLNGRYGTFLS
jgi:hypothetical protein